MKHFIFILAATLLIGCNSSKTENATDKSLNQSVDYEESIMLLGEVNRNGLQMEAFDDWFGSGYENYQPDLETMEALKPLIKDVDITVFLGTWCEDSHRDLPDFFKILDDLDYDESRLTMYAVDEEKVSPEEEIEAYDIIQVPTFIFYRDGKEINRIVEYSIRTIERDMLDILSGKDYMNPYSDF